jgi:RND family efflux transporter MFP subunit
LQLLVLLGVAAGLYGFWRSHDKELPIIDDDDVNVTSQVTVQTGKVTQRTLLQYADVYGIVEPQPARGVQAAADATLSMPIAAKIKSVGCTEGSHVNAGDPLMQLDAPELQIALDRALAMRAAADNARTDAAESTKVSPRDDLRFARDAADRAADVAAARAALGRLSIVSPISGTVLKLNARAGEAPAVGSVLLEIADTNRLVVACATPVAVVAGVHLGAPAELIWYDSPGHQQISKAHVTFIDPAVDPASSAASVDVALDPAETNATTQPAVALRIGQAVHVRLITDQHDALAVPEPALVQDAQGNANISLVERDFRWAVRHQVTAGLHDDGWVEVSAPGLAAGQDVVTVGSNALTDKCRIEVTR